MIAMIAQVARRRQHEERREGGRDRAPRLESRGGTSRGALPGENGVLDSDGFWKPLLVLVNQIVNRLQIRKSLC